MQLTNEQLLPVAKGSAWAALNDISILQSSIPGCESIVPTGQDSYEIALTAAIGPVKAKFKGKLRLTDIHAPDSYVMHFEGSGGPAGHGKGSAEVKLETVGPNETRLVYSANAQVGGKIAQVGSRLVDMAAQKIAADFFQNFNDRLAALYPAEDVSAPTELAPAPSAPSAAPATLWKRVGAWIRGVFGITPK